MVGMAKAGAIWALGAMSGTSVDGVDAAMVRTDGVQIVEFGPHAYRPYTKDERAVIKNGFGLWHAPQVAKVVETAHAQVLARFSGAEVIGFHGQTLAHDPKNHRTYQAGDGHLLAQTLGVPVVYDFRSMDVKMGGQGAPLVPYFHLACAQYLGLTEPVAFLNLGGVGNLTWVDPVTSQLLAFDTGPANAPINDAMQMRLGLTQDQNGALAATGKVDEAMVQRFLTQAYFHKIPPKSLDRDAFSRMLRRLHPMPNADAIATLTAIAAAAVAKGAEHFPKPVTKILVAGGGRHNAVMMQQLRARLNVDVQDIDQTGLNGDMLEAQAFAYLAVRVMRGLPTSGPTTTGVATQISGGIIARPD
jgi:anhydro-N-acetylmuramic acid kinase